MNNSEENSIQPRLTALAKGSEGCRDGGLISSRYSQINADSNSTESPTLRTGTLPKGEIRRNQSGLFFRSM